MKIVVADDESLARINLQSMLTEADETVTIVGEAKNGEELLVLLEQQLPDAVFVDIRMPKLDGLNAIRQGKQISPHTQWVILSGFSKFQYAQEALELGVSHYLLKPVKPSELKQSVDMMRQRASRSLTALHHEFENTLVSLLHQYSRAEDLAPDSPLRLWRMNGYLLYLDGLSPQRPDLHRLLVTEVRKTATEYFYGRNSRLCLTSVPEGQLAVICAWTSGDPSGIEQLTYRFERDLADLIRSFQERHRLCVTPLQTGLCHGIEPLLDQLSRLQTLAPLRTLRPYGRCFNQDDLWNGSSAPDRQWLGIGRRVERIVSRYHAGDYVHFAKETSFLPGDMKSLPPNEQRTILHLMHFVERSIGLAVEDGEAVNWIRRLEHYGETHLLASTGAGADSRDLVQLVIDYVDKNYMNDIGIGQIAKEIGVTYNYLSTLFHKKCGITFIHYLTKIRMLKAKQLLLENPQMKIQKVASEVGYYSTRYFTKAFTKHYKCYPSEIRAFAQHQQLKT